MSEAPVTPALAGLTEEETRNVELAREYMRISYTPGKAGREAVVHLCAPGNIFTVPTTFPKVHTLEEYAEDHGKLMKQVNDLRLVSFDVIFAKADQVAIRYTAEGHHRGEPHGSIAPTGRKACWTAAALFRAKDGKLTAFIKEWNKLAMWEQLGWPTEECRSQQNASNS